MSARSERLIEQLFLEMGREDKLRAPEFASLLSSSKRAAPVRTRSIAVAGGFAMLVLASVVALLSFGKGPTQQDAPQPGQSAAGLPAPAPSEPARGELSVRKPARPKSAVIAKRSRRRPSASDQLTIVAKALAEWESPTAMLLRFPGEEMLTLPRLGESLETVRSLSTDQFN
jgi:hypothetical protein